MTRSVADLAAREMDARLEHAAATPLAVAFSGGGDSMALLLAAALWSRRNGRGLIALTIDHGLQPQSSAWSSWCAARAARLGIAHRTLTWAGEKPRAGLAAAARAARHRLIAEAAREQCARVILFGHTADDVLEADAMRDDGICVPSPRVWSPSPVWPQGRGLFILRPLLGLGRSALREWLAGQGETWIEDPANVDLAQPRARARARLGPSKGRPCAPPPPLDLSPLLAGGRIGAAGEMRLPLGAVKTASAGDTRRLLDVAIASVAGGERVAHGPCFRRLPELLARSDDFVSTMGGAMTSSDGTHLGVVREIQDQRSRPTPTLALPVGQTVIWDGRFEVRSLEPGVTLAPLAGRSARLANAVRARVAALPPGARRALPTLIDSAGAVNCPTLMPDPRVEILGLVAARLAGGCGLVHTEAQIAEAADALNL